jgi:DNA helicase-2/ATP-dependent DNA helicase PcrA
MFHADLHIHSRYSRACSRDCDIEHLAWWAQRKGITVVGTGDFTHPAWAADLRESLIPAEPGLLRLRPELEARLRRTSPPSCAGQVRFMLSSEISTIYRGGDRTRKVHHLIYAPTFEAADRITEALAKIGNLASDGRPILGLDSRNLLEITLAGGPGCYLVPAHAWTPWFAVLGSKSGFDLVADCYGDLADQVFAIETGLSSDPPMNWMCSSLDRYQLVSNSDAHSPPMLGREATTLSCDLDYFAIADAFRTGTGLAGTIEFFPEEGKYHLDGHRKCGIRLDPARSNDHAGICPACEKPLTIGVLHRVAELADRPLGYRPPNAPAFANLVQLRQIVGEIVATGPASKKVTTEVSRLVSVLGPELGILCDVPVSDIQRAGGSLLAEAVTRLRQGAVVREAGYDGEYGTVALFAPGEIGAGPALFDLAELELPPVKPPGPGQLVPEPLSPDGQTPVAAARTRPALPVPQPRAAPETDAIDAEAPSEADAIDAAATPSGPLAGLLEQLDADQRAAARADSPLMIVAGPGTGKTRTLTYRIAYQLAASGRPGTSCLAVTFTRRAAEEMRTRLETLSRLATAHSTPAAPAPALSLADVTVTTFHGLGLLILRELHELAGLPADFQVADEAAMLAVAAELAGSDQAGRDLLTAAAGDQAARESLVKELTARGLVDFDGLIELAVALLSAHPGAAGSLRRRWPMISVDEYQDIDAAQYDLLRLLAGDGAGLTAIGDPDQAIYGFRGGDVGFFLRFGQDYPAAATRQLSVSYRSGRPIVAAAAAAVAPATLVPGRRLQAVAGGPPVTAHEAADEHAEAAWISATIDELLGGSSFHSLDSGRASGHGHAGLSLADIAVLYRTDAQSAVLGQALARSGLTFRKGSHDLLQRRTGVPEVIAELRAGPSKAKTVAARLTRAVATVAGRHPGPGAIDIRSAGELLAPLARRCGEDLDRFWTEVSLGAAVDALDPRADAITLLTLHAAKGLEFEVVFLAGCEYGLLPLHLPWADTDEAEERRLLFVGMTRARSRLLLSYAATRTRHGSAADAGPSPFLRAIGPGLLNHPDPARPRRPAQRQLRLL